jgi:hypothetical protein
MTLPPPLPPPLPPRRDVRAPHAEITSGMSVTKIGYDQLEVRVGSVTALLTRQETFRLIGMLERVGGSL